MDYVLIVIIIIFLILFPFLGAPGSGYGNYHKQIKSNILFINLPLPVNLFSS